MILRFLPGQLNALLGGLLGGLMFVAAAAAQQPTEAPNPGRDAVMSKCFQCHTDSMFRHQPETRRAWEATIYRMIGRGGLYTRYDRARVAYHPAADLGADAKPAAAAK